MTIAKSVPEVYAKLGVRPVIHGAGTTTRYGGSLMRPETIEAMREAAQALVNLDELNEAAGAAIARMLGAEAALVTAGSTAGLVLQAAACITGDNPAHIARLPDVTGLRHEFIIQRAHRFSYDQAYRVPGGVLVEIGLGRRTMAWELEHAIGERTAGVIHLVSPFTSPPGVLGFEEVCRIAHARGVPVLVDAASMIPPRDNLFRYLRGGADLVIFSGGKGIRGPQSTGILAGRRDLIRAATLNASPNQAIGRAAKTSKEEVVGLVTALELFLAEDEKAETERFRAVSASIVDGIADIPGLWWWSSRIRSTASCRRRSSTSSRHGRDRRGGPCSSRSRRASPTSTCSRARIRAAMPTRSRSTPSTCSPGTTPSSSDGCARS